MQAYFDDLATARTVSLTTFRRDGTPVATPVHIVTDGDVAYVRTFDSAGKFKRVRNDPRVELAPCTTRGRVTGAARPAKARVLDGEEADRAAAALAAKYPVLQGVLIPLGHRLRGMTTVHLQLTAP